MDDNQAETRQERREEKLNKKRERMPQHAKGLARLYKEVIIKQINKLRNDKQKQQEK